MLRRTCGAVLAAAGAALALWVGGQCVLGAGKGAYTARVLQAVGQAPPSIAWAGKSWLGDDAPFAAIRNTIDRQIVDQQNPNSLLVLYREEAQASPKDPQKVFAWAYSSRKAINPSTSIDKRAELSLGVHQALLAVPFPNTYNYARILFLTAETNYRLIPVGERLLARVPQDEAVKVKLIDTYDSQIAVDGVYRSRLNMRAKQRALVLVEQLLHRNPTNPAYHAMRASIYISAYYADNFKNPQDGRKAIAADREFLRLGPPNPESIPIAQGEITEIEEKLTVTTR